MWNVNSKDVARITWEYCALLYCHSCYFVAQKIIKLHDDTKYRNRILEFGHCPKCKALKAQVKRYRIEDGKYSELKPKSQKKVTKFIKKYKKEAYFETPNLKVKYGLKANMGWRYADASKSSWVKDFNNVRQFEIYKDVKVPC